MHHRAAPRHLVAAAGPPVCPLGTPAGRRRLVRVGSGSGSVLGDEWLDTPPFGC